MSKKIIIASVVALLIGVGVVIYKGSKTVEDMPVEEAISQPQEKIKSEIKEEKMETDDNMAEGYIDISPSQARDMINNNSNLVVIDVSPHYDKGHLPGAVHYYLGDGSLDKAIPSLDKSKEYLVYCHVDSVAIAGAQKLIDAGFSPVYRLEGNYGAWISSGYPVEK